MFGIPVEFLIFAATLAGVAIFHDHTLIAALGGLAAVTLYKACFTDFRFAAHLRGEGPILANLFGLLLGFAVLAHHVEDSKLPLVMPRLLPDDWKGPFVLLLMVFALSALLDNIAATLIGGAVTHAVFKGRVHVGYLAALVAAGNAGGAGSVLGDTTTTMLWIAGVPAAKVLDAYVGSFAALAAFGFFASRQQDRHQRIAADPPRGVRLDWGRVMAAAAILAGALVTNLWIGFPAAGVWAAILLAAPVAGIPWKTLPPALRGAAFLLALVLLASLMPVEKLPRPSWPGVFGLGFLSAVFDNIPLTKLALQQGGYDWGMLAYAVGFGGSMIWFGSSAGVALAGVFPEMRSVGLWLKQGWHVAVAYVAGFSALLFITGWQPLALRAPGAEPAKVETATTQPPSGFPSSSTR
jgi:Na+/H+ antiporter NhaD/arsenite permease-like protein